jgi:hypothetical protein
MAFAVHDDTIWLKRVEKQREALIAEPVPRVGLPTVLPSVPLISRTLSGVSKVRSSERGDVRLLFRTLPSVYMVMSRLVSLITGATEAQTAANLRRPRTISECDQFRIGQQRLGAALIPCSIIFSMDG